MELPPRPLPTPESIKALFAMEVGSSEKEASVLLNEADSFLSQGRYVLAIKRCKQVLLGDPDNFLAKAKLNDMRVLLFKYGKKVNPAAFE